MKHEETSSRHPARKPTNAERQNPSTDADAIPGDKSRASGPGAAQRRRGPTPNEIMNEQASPRDEQGNRDQSDKPHVSG
ncbi:MULTISPECIES: hypothetical protein [unclassified Cupriavidus]|uniref:hypothetical protein n=1 Tax=unclassified Cupriavidus TaxID=2640874 RepID=UPI001C003FD6|nr:MULTISPECIES: hypothetical protein [unclassified Cupriavidus]MCA3182859.1 hypothetical protein [Cupriavidus sp.]MCA3191820.1 hypothetical protein [Cupriavidus sp.]MCA3198051.1 hypothetical protein [Cupriavidus sp.]MCA3200734.1 hypothetical protein [Cupriavidus sp.]MCA3207769.1 hypothetical protein [Cupriavidus sp.]